MRPGYLIRITLTQLGMAQGARSAAIAEGRTLAAATLLVLAFGGLITAPGAQAQTPNRIVCSKDHAEMILISEAPFVFGMSRKEIQSLLKKYGLPWAEIYAEEHARQQKQVAAFYIDRHEVTNSQYEQFMKETGHREPKYWRRRLLNGPRQPVVGVGWADAEAYAKWAGKRLPTEEEWEKAARGTDGRAWPWGNAPHNAFYNGRAQSNGAPVDVGTFSPMGDSVYGVSDMAGNVWEMTSGIWQDGSKAMRGGSFLNPVGDVRVTVRWSAADQDRGAVWLGFRCVMDATNWRQFARPK
jgi:formylglycine-generating enzyme required for sulfatase activity